MKIRCAAFLIAIAGAGAGAGTVQAANLWDVYQLALKNDPAYLQAQADYAAALENKPIARAGYLPDVTLNGTATRSFGLPATPAHTQTRSAASGSSGILAPRETQYGLQLTQPIFNWARWKTIEQADASVAEAQAVFLAARQALIVNTASAYFAVITARDTLAADHAATQANARLLAQAKAGARVGTKSSTDLEQARAAFDLAVATEIAAEQRVTDTEEALRVITGAPAGELQKPPADMPLRAPVPGNPAHWVRQATQANPHLMAAQAAVKVAAAGVGIEQAGHLPTLGISAGYQRERTSGSVAGNEDIRLRQATLGLTLPVFAGGGVSAAVTQAERQLDAARAQARFVKRETVQQVRTAYLGVLSGISQVNALRQSVASNRSALKATQIGLQVGNKTLTDVLLAVQNLEAAETAFAGARDAYLTSVLALQQAAGSASAGDVQAVSALLTEPTPAPQGASATAPAAAATTPIVPSASSSAGAAG